MNKIQGKRNNQNRLENLKHALESSLDSRLEKDILKFGIMQGLFFFSSTLK